MQIRARLTLIYLMVTGTILLVSFGLIYFFSVRSEHRDFTDMLFKKAKTSADLLLKVSEVDSSLLRIIDRSKSDLLISENISIYNEAGSEIYTSNDTIHFHMLIPDFQEVHRNALDEGRLNLAINEMEIVAMAYRYREQQFLIMAGAVDLQGKRYLDGLWQTLLLVLISVLCISGYVGWWYSGRTLRPIQKVMSELKEITSTDLKNRLNELGSNDEIDQLIKAFNDLLDRLQKAFDDQRSFVSYASHELNNPLASLTMQIEVALLKERDREEHQRILEQLRIEIERLREVTGQLLILSGISSQSDIQSRKRTRVDDLVFNLVQRYTVKYSGCRIEMDVNLPEDEALLEISINPSILDSALSNLIENACKYSDSGIVRVRMSFAESLRISVANPVKDVTMEEVSQWFEPYFRKRTNTKAGFGIGLTIVQRICDASGIRLIKEVRDQWVSFTLEF